MANSNGLERVTCNVPAQLLQDGKPVEVLVALVDGELRVQCLDPEDGRSNVVLERPPLSGDNTKEKWQALGYPPTFCRICSIRLREKAGKETLSESIKAGEVIPDFVEVRCIKSILV